MSASIKSESLWSAEESPALEFLLDSCQRIEAANPAARRAVSLDGAGQSLVGRDFRDLLTRGGRVFFQSHVLPQLQLQGEVGEVYLSLQLSSKRELGCVMAAREVRSAEAETLTRITLLPMSRRVIVEKTLRDARTNLELASLKEQTLREQLQETQARMTVREHLAALGTLAAGVAHELNNPLTYVLGNLALLEGTLGSQAPDYLKEIQDGIERIRAIVAGLRVYSRGEEGRRVPLDLNLVANTALRLVAGQLKRNCRVESYLAGEPLVVSGDDGKLVQVVVNLLLNASQALEDTKGLVTLRCRRDEAWAVLEVEDTGPGVPEPIREHIYEPFVTTKPVGTGTGLGLYLAREIITSMGGSLDLVDPPGGGACFRVRLPSSHFEVPNLPVPTPGPSESGMDAQPRILIVDDDPKVARVLSIGLKPWKVRIAEDGPEALTLIEGGEPFDVVICDLVMPTYSGLDILGRLVQLDPEWERRFLFLSGGALDDDTARYLQRCQTAFLQKPVTAAKLREVCLQIRGRSKTALR